MSDSAIAACGARRAEGSANYAEGDKEKRVTDSLQPYLSMHVDAWKAENHEEMPGKREKPIASDIEKHEYDNLLRLGKIFLEYCRKRAVEYSRLPNGSGFYVGWGRPGGSDE
jgi:hypothetical protein